MEIRSNMHFDTVGSTYNLMVVSIDNTHVIIAFCMTDYAYAYVCTCECVCVFLCTPKHYTADVAANCAAGQT